MQLFAQPFSSYRQKGRVRPPPRRARQRRAQFSASEEVLQLPDFSRLVIDLDPPLRADTAATHRPNCSPLLFTNGSQEQRPLQRDHGRHLGGDGDCFIRGQSCHGIGRWQVQQPRPPRTTRSHRLAPTEPRASTRGGAGIEPDLYQSCMGTPAMKPDAINPAPSGMTPLPPHVARAGSEPALTQ